MLPLLTFAIVIALMLAEANLSRRHDRRLRARGASEPSGDVYRSMQVAYPAAFAIMAIEGAVGGTSGFPWWHAGLSVFVAAKALKYWAIATLGTRWTFRVLVLPDEPLVTSGPYRVLSHPNYVAVIGELCGIAGMMGAWLTGVVACAGFGSLILRRIAVEARALRASPRAR